MQITLKPSDALEQIRTACLVVGIPAGNAMSETVARLDRATGGVIARLRARGDLGDEPGQTLLLPAVDGIKAERLLLVGLGKAATLGEPDYRKIVNAVLSVLAERKVGDASWALPAVTVGNHAPEWALRELAQLAMLRHYRYSETVSKPKPAFALAKLVIVEPVAEAARNAIRVGTAIANGMNAARRLGDLPPNICTPAFLAQEATALASGKGTTSSDKKGSTKQRAGDAPRLKVTVLDEKQMTKLGMGALLSVAAGTEQPARLIVIEYRGGGQERPQVLVGKGITFDSGGISIKPAAKMDEMKYDMCGAASVIGTLTAVAELQLRLNVVGIIAAAENLPSGRATKPGDVVKSLSGQTIEVLNTDAEGRLMLCDALTYAARYEPAAVIDIATLTGACVVALGKHASGLFSNDDALAESLLAAGQRTGDRAWRLPLWDDYQKQLDSNFADMANVGGAGGGSITAACFLARFTRDYQWAHLDIAGTAWDEGAAKGATGRPVPLLTDYLLQVAERPAPAAGQARTTGRRAAVRRAPKK